MNNKLDALVGIKGLGAIVIALFFHYNHFIAAIYHPLYQIPILNVLCERGWMAVELFFFLSGVTYMSIYSQKIRKGDYSGEKFAVDRFSKLWPIHMVTLLVVTFVQGLRVENGMPQFKFIANDLYDFFLNILMLQSLGIENGAGYNWVAWTLTVNMLLYFVFYWVCKKTNNDNEIFIVCLIFIVLGFFIMKKGQWFIFSENVGRGFSSFYLGVLFVVLYDRVENVKSALVIWLTILLLFGYGLVMYLFGGELNDNFTILASVYCGTFLPLIITLIIRIPVLSTFFSCKALKALGKISFSLFMVHYPIQCVLVTLNDLFKIGWDYSRFGFWLAYALLCIGCAGVCHEYIEVVCSKKIRTFYAKRNEVMIR